MYILGCRKFQSEFERWRLLIMSILGIDSCTLMYKSKEPMKRRELDH